jgi:hypothetical protein
MPIPRPILRRKPLPKQAPPAVLNQRLRQQQRLVTTPGFAARVRVQGPGRPAAMVPIAVAALLGCVGGVGVFLGWLQASWMLAAGGAVAAAAGVVMGRRAMRPPVADTPGMAVIDEGDAARLDAVVERCAPELPDAAVEALTQLAATLGRMARRKIPRAIPRKMNSCITARPSASQKPRNAKLPKDSPGFFH